MNPRTTALILGVCLAWPAGSRAQDFTFLGCTYLPHEVSDVELIDVDDDGDADVVTPSLTTSDLLILENLGPGVLPTQLAVAVDAGPVAVAGGDLDGDGDTDLVTANAASVSVLLRNAGGWSRVDHAVPSGPAGYVASGSPLAIVDVDGNGTADVLHEAGYLPGIGGGALGNFVAFTLPFASVLEVAPVDLDGDGDLDFAALVVTAPPSGPLGLQFLLATLLNDGFGALSLGATMELPQSLFVTSSMATGDMNGDGFDDVVVRGPFQLGSAVRVLLSDGAGNLLPYGMATSPPFSSYELGPELGDVDGDGDLDVVITQTATFSFPPQQRAILNQGCGFLLDDATATVGSGILISSIPGTAPFASGDLFGDGLDDVVVVDDLTNPGDGLCLFQSGVTPTANIDFVERLTDPAPTITAGDSLTLSVRVSTCAGVPVSGATVVWTAIGDTGTFTSPTIVATDPSGVAVASYTSGAASAAPFTIRATVSGGASVDFDVNEVAGVLFVVAGDDQLTNAGVPFAPVVVQATTTTGSPLAGVPITFSFATPSTVGLSLSSAMVTTGATGSASTTVIQLPTAVSPFPTEFAVTASSPGFISTTFSARVRSLLTLTQGSTLTVRYDHEPTTAPPVRLIVAFDVPQPPPGFVSTPLGDIYTSGLAPGPSFAALDGLGAYGPADPAIATTPTTVLTHLVERFQVQFNTAAVPPGLQIVMQVLSYDPQYPFPESYGISNPVFHTF